MSKLIMVHTIAKVRYAYAVRIDSDAVPEEVAEKILAGEICPAEIYHTRCTERFETSYDITEEDVVKLVDNHNPNSLNLSAEEKLACIINCSKSNE